MVLSFYPDKVFELMDGQQEVYISVDIETSGPVPGVFSMLTIGACNIDDPSQSFSCELQPISQNADPEAMKVTGLSLERLALTGEHPVTALTRFREWIAGQVNPDQTPVFVGLNAPFDWSFINYYFHHFLKFNPFGFTALDIKALYMGATGVNWGETRSSKMAEKLRPQREGNHQALQDAQYQAELFRIIRSLRAL
jgi:DNA polymerase III epsilon subunit-like protein